MWACAALGGRGRDAVVEYTEHLFIPSCSVIIHKKNMKKVVMVVR